MRFLLSVSLLAVVACGGSDVVAPAAIAGKWAEGFTVPGNGFEMDLSASGSSVSGVGTWAGEAGPSGTLSVTGTSDATGVHLDLVFTETVPRAGNVSISHFDGRLSSSNILSGSIHVANTGQPPGPDGPITYHRA